MTSQNDELPDYGRYLLPRPRIGGFAKSPRTLRTDFLLTGCMALGCGRADPAEALGRAQSR